MANGTLKVSNIQTSSGSGTITIGQSGETITIPSGATVSGAGANTPVFSARKTGSAQSLSDGSYVKITFNTVDIDTDSAYSSDRFTVPSGQAGKYLFNASIMFENDTHSATQYAITAFYKNGSQVTENQLDFRNNYGGYGNNLAHSFIIDLAASDYIEVYGAMGKQSGTITANYHATKVRTFFQGCKLIGA
jgi:hypothetical protein